MVNCLHPLGVVAVIVLPKMLKFPRLPSICEYSRLFATEFQPLPVMTLLLICDLEVYCFPTVMPPRSIIPYNAMVNCHIVCSSRSHNIKALCRITFYDKSLK